MIYASEIDDAIAAFLKGNSIREPPVDCLALARRDSSWRAPIVPEVMRGSAAQERVWLQGIAAVELLQVHVIPPVLAQYDDDQTENCGKAIRSLAVRYFPHLLMPTEWFHHDSRHCQSDLIALYHRYQTVGLESIARRMLDLPEFIVVSIFENAHLVERESNVAPLQKLTVAEQEVQGYCHDYSRVRHASSEQGRISGWPLHRADWRREIILFWPEKTANVPEDASTGVVAF